MCRIFFLKTKNKERALKYIEAWKKASENDPYLQKVAEELNIKGIKNKHMHGWGYLFLDFNNFYIYKTIKPIYEDKNFEKLKELISNAEKEFLILGLTRITDVGYYSSIDSHPFSFITKDNNEIVEVFITYNGLINYEEISKEYNLNDKVFEKRNTLLSLLTALIYDTSKPLKERMIEFKKFAKSGYNLFSILVYPERIKAFIMAYAKPELLKKDFLFNYYSVAKKIEDDLVFAGNKLIAEILEKEGEKGFEIMKNGEYFEVEFEINKKYFNGYI